MSCQVKSSNVWEHGAIQRFTVGVGAVIPPPQVPWFNKGILHEQIKSMYLARVLENGIVHSDLRWSDDVLRMATLTLR